MRALVIGHDDDIFKWCICQVHELLQERLSVGRVRLVGRHVNELTVVAANDAVYGHTPSSSGLHRQCHRLTGCGPSLSGGVPQVDGGLVHVVDLLGDLDAQKLHHKVLLLFTDLTGPVQLVDTVQVHCPHSDAVTNVIFAQGTYVQYNTESPLDVDAPVTQ